MNTVKRCLLALMLSFSLATSHVSAHDSRPVLVQIDESEDLVLVDIKAPSSLDLANFPSILLPRFCKIYSTSPTKKLTQANFNKTTWRCEKPLMGEQVSIAFPSSNPSLSSLIKWHTPNNHLYSQLLSPNETVWTLPQQASTMSTVWQYTLMGAQHILVGIDHLLFVACLLMLANSFKRAVLTITGFTLGHSITLVAATMGLVSVPVALFEALIGLSIVFLVIEIIKRQTSSWAYQYPMMIAVMFGLLHGLGFASVLSEVGLPQHQIFWGLLAFNIGIELGQIAFVGMLLSIVAGSRLLLSQRMMKLSKSAVLLGVGYLSAFWFWERAFGQFIQELV